jgi:hypothetical protein
MSLFKDRGTHSSSPKKTSRRSWSAVDVAGYRIDVIHPERRALVGWNPSLLKVASLSIGYLLILTAVTRAMAGYLGWSPTLLLFGAAHLGFGLVGLPRETSLASEAEVEAAPMGVPGWHLAQAEGEAVSQTGERASTPAPHPPTVRPPAFPPRTRSVT